MVWLGRLLVLTFLTHILLVKRAVSGILIA